MRKYMCPKGQGIVEAVDKDHAKEKFGCAVDCKHSYDRLRDAPQLARVLFRNTKGVCMGPDMCASR